MKTIILVKVSTLYIIILFSFGLTSCSNDDDLPDNNDNEQTGLCEVLAIEDEDLFLNGPDELYNISAIDLDGNCLQINMLAPGCTGNNWDVDLIAPESEYTTWPPSKAIRLALTTNEDCEAYINKTVSFDLSPLQKENTDLVILSLEGWTTPIFYEY